MILFAFLIDGKPYWTQHKKLDLDEVLFQKIVEEDMEAFEHLYQMTHRTMYAYILSMARNHEDALDILQETYLKIRSAAHLYKPMGKPLAWMFTIARNLYRSQLRLKDNVPKDSVVEMENSLALSYVSDPTDRLVLESALAILSEEERQIILLHAVSGLKHREIADSIGLPLSTTLSKYHRGLKKLRKHLNDKGGF